MSSSFPAFERPKIGVANAVFKSGPLFISSKGIGWKSWKKRWFILTRTSLVFFKNNPSALPQRGGEVNLTLGGIDLNNSGSVVVREDKKLLTVLFPDGCDGRAFTLKAESAEDLYEWKTALEHALAQAPSAALVMGPNGIFRNDTNDMSEGSFPQWRDKRLVKSLVVGRPILLALEDIDGGPSFLEKALQFLETYGTKVEGILRQSADVEEVDCRVNEYEQGKTEFGPEEDAHVVGDCVKYVLRELPSSPVPASCCTALLEAYKIDRKEVQLNATRSAISETFPEPNRRLLQRILKMMHTISLHASENRMTPSAIAACMAPLLLRPLLAGECELDDDFNTYDDNSAQLLAAANAANSAQAIITTLLEEYENIFYDDNLPRCSISACSHSENSGSENSTDDEILDVNENGYHDAENEIDPDTDDYPDTERVLSGKLSESSGYGGSDLYDCKAFRGDDSDVGLSKEIISALKSNPPLDLQLHIDSNQVSEQHRRFNKASESELGTPDYRPGNESHQLMGDMLSSGDLGLYQSKSVAEFTDKKSTRKITSSDLGVNRQAFWGSGTAQKTSSAESIDSSVEEELAIQRLEVAKNELQQRIAKEARGNAILQASLERRKQALHERRLALQQDVSRLQEQLQAERDLRATLDVGFSMSSDQFSSSDGLDSKTRAELEEIALAEADVARLKQKVAELHHQLNLQSQNHYRSFSDVGDHHQHALDHNSQQKYLQQDFDTKLAFCNHERKQRTEEESILGADLKSSQGQVLTSGSSCRQPAQRKFVDSSDLSDRQNSDASSASTSLDDLCAVDSSPTPSTLKKMDNSRLPTGVSSAMVELTRRLGFFKERRTQLMDQLQKLDLNYGKPSRGNMYKAPSPRWN